MKFKRYCKTLELKDDQELIRKYIEAHRPEAVWPEIAQGMREVGIVDMEIYAHGNRLFMIMETEPDFDHDKAMRELAGKPRQQEWEAYMSQFQKAPEDASAAAKWQLMDRIYKMEE